MSYFIFDGITVDQDSPILSSSTRAYRYGDGFFESLKVSNGRVMHGFLHQQRIDKSLLLLKMNNPECLENSSLEDCIERFCKTKKIQNARVRASFLREADGFYQPKNQFTRLIIEISPIDYSGYPLNSTGLVLGNYKELTKNSNFISTLKTNSSLIYVMAGIFAKTNDWDDCVIFNEYGNVCEATASNLFIVSGEFIATPPISEYCVDGVMRKIVLQLAQSYGYQTIERPIRELELSAAHEIFLTSATRGIQWVGQYNGKSYKNVFSKVLSDKLADSE